MIIEFIIFWWCYWILAYGPFAGSILITGSITAGVGIWIRLWK